jgi:hypothetical protein
MLSEKLINKIKLIYGEDSSQVLSKFEEYTNQKEWVSHEKVINAILKLSKGDILKVDKYLKMAKIDPRDVVMLADEK